MSLKTISKATVHARLKIASSLGYRMRLARFGMFYLNGSSLSIRSVNIGNKTVEVDFPEGERETQKWELIRLLFFDCYKLSRMTKPVATVLDIGANLGFFALAARKAFPEAKIHCYEPNLQLEPYLSKHCTAADAEYFLSAVGACEARVRLETKGNSLHSVSRVDPESATTQIAFAEAVARLGEVDVLKLDCEGAEWDIFSDPRPWAHVRQVAMEYHLWARPALSINSLRAELSRLGFQEISTTPDPYPGANWGLAWAKK